MLYTTDEFKDYFSKFGKVVEHQIMKDRSTGRSRGFGFITFESEQDARKIISRGRMLELGGKQVFYDFLFLVLYRHPDPVMLAFFYIFS